MRRGEVQGISFNVDQRAQDARSLEERLDRFQEVVARLSLRDNLEEMRVLTEQNLSALTAHQTANQQTVDELLRSYDDVETALQELSSVLADLRGLIEKVGGNADLERTVLIKLYTKLNEG